MGTANTIWCALIILAVALVINLAGTRALAMAAIIGFSAERRASFRRRDVHVVRHVDAFRGRSVPGGPGSIRPPRLRQLLLYEWDRSLLRYFS